MNKNGICLSQNDDATFGSRREDSVAVVQQSKETETRPTNGASSDEIRSNSPEVSPIRHENGDLGS